jgi:protein SCO1/2
MPAFDGATPVGELVAYVDCVRAIPALRDDLVDLLAEQSPLYAGRGTAETERIRGYLLASFETTGLPSAAIDYVLEELESSWNPYTVAAAAKAMRGAEPIPERTVALLIAALKRIRLCDDFVSFERAPGDVTGRTATTALMEILRTLAWLGSRARPATAPLHAMMDRGAFSPAVRAEAENTILAISGGEAPSAPRCCGNSARVSVPVPAGRRCSSSSPVGGLKLEDQNGTIVTFDAFFRGRPSIATFFYTRCMNPEKCSLTVTKLARLQKRIRDQGLHGRVNIAAFTYDPAFDLPRRLRAYGSDRGMAFDAHNRMMRTTGPFEPLQQYFELGVGYGTVTVNRHRTDLFILDAQGQPIFGVARRLWDETEVLDRLKAAL